MSLLSAESAKLAQVQQELRQVRDHESMTARTAALSHAAMSSRIEVSSSIGADTNVVPSTPAPSREHQPEVATQLIYGEGRAAPFPHSNPSANIDHLFAMYDQSAAASPMRHGTSSSSSSTVAPIPAGRLGSDLGEPPINSCQLNTSWGEARFPEWREFHCRLSQAFHPIPRAAREHRAV